MKSMKRYILLLCVCALALLPAKAQGEMDIDWTVYAQDTVLPVFMHSIDLGYDHAQEYTANIEYPELVPLTAAEAARYGLPAAEGLPEWPEVRAQVGISAKRGQLDISFVPMIWRDGKYWRIQSFTLKVQPLARAPQWGSRADGGSRYAAHSVLSEGRWVKLRVADNGIHMLTHARLKRMGFGDPSRVRLYGYGGHLLSETDPDLWTDDLCEVPLWRGDDRILFYANGSVQWTLEDDNTFTHTRNPYSDYGYYFLTEGAEQLTNAVPEAVPSPEAQPRVMTTPAYALHEVDDYAWFHGGRKLVESYDFQNGNVRRYSLPTPAAHPSHKATLDVCFTHNASVTTSVAVAVGETTVGNFTLRTVGTHDEAVEATRSFAVDLDESSDQHKVTLKHQREAGVSGRLDYLRLSYTRDIGMDVPIYATDAGTHTYNLGAVSDVNNVAVWRITGASAIEPVAYDKYTSTFTADGQRGDVFIAFKIGRAHV